MKTKKKKLVLLGSREKGEWRMIASGYEVSLGVMTIFWNSIVVIVPLCKYTENYYIAYLKSVNFISIKYIIRILTGYHPVLFV